MSKAIVSTETIIHALADFLKTRFPDSTIYSNPNQQNTKLPAWFINFVPDTGIKKEIGNRYVRTFHMDLAYLEEYNLPDLYDRYIRAAEIVDEHLEWFEIKHEDQAVLLKTHDRKWKVDLSSLHYRFKIKVHVSKSGAERTPLRTIERLNEFVLEE